jgi:acyl-CoA synthetase (NDP forming)
VDAAAELLGLLPAGATVQPGVVQLTYRAVPADFAHAVRTLLADDHVDALIVIYAPPLPKLVGVPIDVLRDLEPNLTKPVVAVMVGLDDGPLAPGSHVPVFAFPEPAAGVLGRIAKHVDARVLPPEADGRRLADIDGDEAEAVIRHALEVRPGGTLLPLPATQDLLRSYGILVAEGRAISTREAAFAAAREIGYPVVLKSTAIVRTGRSERAGIALDLHDEAELARAWAAIEAELGSAALVEAIVQRMVRPGVDLRVTVELHRMFGPVVTFGLGGMLADAIGDRVPRLVPFAPGEAAAVIGASRAAFALTDRDARRGVEDLLERVALLADDRAELDSLVINPALASPDGCWVTDATARVCPAERQADTPVRRLG